MDVDSCSESKMYYLQTYMTLCIVLAIYITSSETSCGEGFRRYNHPSKPLFKCCKIIECHEGYTAQECDVHNGNEKCVRDATPTFGSKTEEYPTTSRTQTAQYTTTAVADLTNQVSTKQTTVEITAMISNTTSSEITSGERSLVSTSEPTQGEGSMDINVTNTQEHEVSTAPPKTARQLWVLLPFIFMRLLCRNG